MRVRGVRFVVSVVDFFIIIRAVVSSLILDAFLAVIVFVLSKVGRNVFNVLVVEFVFGNSF